jgi:hypothetical protein
MQLGFASVGTVGRTANASDGAPIAPLQYTVMPSLVHRWGGLMALASVTYGRYVDGEGYNLATGLRLQYRFKLDAGRRLKLWSKLGGSRDVVQQAAVRSGQLALGLQYSW